MQVGQTNFPKPHHFDINDDVTLLAPKSRPVHSSIPRGNGPDLPAWVAFDKQVLGFDAYYTEDVSQRPSEPYRVHRCKVMFYLEYDTMQVVEPRDDNSGLTQGPSHIYIVLHGLYTIHSLFAPGPIRSPERIGQ